MTAQPNPEAFERLAARRALELKLDRASNLAAATSKTLRHLMLDVSRSDAELAALHDRVFRIQHERLLAALAELPALVEAVSS